MTLPRPRATDAGLFRHCPCCGAGLERTQIRGRRRPRCPACGYVQWRNPVVGVAAIIREAPVVALLGVDRIRRGLRDPGWHPAPDRSRILLVRRAGSRAGAWCIPCGYVEVDEEIREALVREMREELGLETVAEEVQAVHSNFHDPDRQSVGVWFRATPVGGTLEPGDDAEAVGFFEPAAPPEPLAFPTDRLVLNALRRPI